MKNLIATGHPAVTEAATALFAAGGNAFDAVVGAAFASCVAEPLLVGLGGGGFLMARTADGEEVLFDFFADIPGRGRAPVDEAELDFFPVVVSFLRADQIFHVGRGSVAVPGMPKGLLHVHGRLGRLPLGEVLAPARQLAARGLEINAPQAEVARLLEPILRTSERALADFTGRDGELIRAGDRYRPAELADFLESLTEEPEAFYRGWVADRMVRDMAEDGGVLTREDLEAYRVIERRPLEVSYRGARVLTNPAPSLGGPLIALALDLQEAVSLRDSEWGSWTHVRALASVLREVDRVRDRGGALPGFDSPELQGHREAVRVSTGGTTHISIADSEGNLAALTGSNGEGSGYYVPGTGIMLNNMMGEDDLHPEGFHMGSPGERISSMMAPTLLMGEEARTTVMGSGGSKRIRSAIHQVITNLVDFGLDLGQAVNRPRIHRTGGVLQVEPGYPEEGLRALDGDHPRTEWDRTDLFFGGVHAVSPDTDEAAGDHRRAGDSSIVSVTSPEGS